MSRQGEVPDWLYGCWRLRRAEAGVEILPGTRMEFHDEGRLIYVVRMEGQDAQFELEYAVEGAYLHTFHSDGGHVNAAHFTRTEENLLQFDFAGRRAWFVRERLM